MQRRLSNVRCHGCTQQYSYYSGTYVGQALSERRQKVMHKKTTGGERQRCIEISPKLLCSLLPFFGIYGSFCLRTLNLLFQLFWRGAKEKVGESLSDKGKGKDSPEEISFLPSLFQFPACFVALFSFPPPPSPSCLSRLPPSHLSSVLSLALSSSVRFSPSAKCASLEGDVRRRKRKRR